MSRSVRARRSARSASRAASARCARSAAAFTRARAASAWSCAGGPDGVEFPGVLLACGFQRGGSLRRGAGWRCRARVRRYRGRPRRPAARATAAPSWSARPADRACSSRACASAARALGLGGVGGFPRRSRRLVGLGGLRLRRRPRGPRRGGGPPRPRRPARRPARARRRRPASGCLRGDPARPTGQQLTQARPAPGLPGPPRRRRRRHRRGRARAGRCSAKPPGDSSPQNCRGPVPDSRGGSGAAQPGRLQTRLAAAAGVTVIIAVISSTPGVPFRFASFRFPASPQS